jgi:hypothetical protein
MYLGDAIATSQLKSINKPLVSKPPIPILLLSHYLLWFFYRQPHATEHFLAVASKSVCSPILSGAGTWTVLFLDGLARPFGTIQNTAQHIKFWTVPA